MPDDDDKGDAAAYRERLDRITEIFAGMVGHAEVQARFRCPYRDRHDRCTAAIRCRAQLKVEGDDGAPICTHDGTFDYRVAWDSNPGHYDRAKKRIARIKRDAEARRKASRDSGP